MAIDRGSIKGRKVTVMGLGRFGGGLGAISWLHEAGAMLTVTDLAPPDQLQEPLAAMKAISRGGADIELRLGGHEEIDFTQADLVVANPAVPTPWSNRFLAAARDAGVPVTSEICLALANLGGAGHGPPRTIAVTGSAGKSTTTAMIHHLLGSLGQQCLLGGNIGGSLLEHVHVLDADSWIALELSSAQLHWLRDHHENGLLDWAPTIGCLTNISPNHLDWHGNLEHYIRCKSWIRSCCDHKDTRFCSRFELSTDAESIQSTSGSAAWWETDLKHIDQWNHGVLSIPGSHNMENAMLAIEAVRLGLVEAGIQDPGEESLASLLPDFKGLPHRLRLVVEAGGIKAFDDSKSTTPTATALAVASFTDRSRVHLIAGGYDKGSDLGQIASMAGELGGLYTIGQTGKTLATDERAHDCGTLEVAVGQAIARMKSGDSILLSPGCASWDQFANYQERGDAFTRLVLSELGHHEAVSTAGP